MGAGRQGRALRRRSWAAPPVQMHCDLPACWPPHCHRRRHWRDFTLPIYVHHGTGDKCALRSRCAVLCTDLPAAVAALPGASAERKVRVAAAPAGAPAPRRARRLWRRRAARTRCCTWCPAGSTRCGAVEWGQQMLSLGRCWVAAPPPMPPLSQPNPPPATLFPCPLPPPTSAGHVQSGRGGGAHARDGGLGQAARGGGGPGRRHRQDVAAFFACLVRIFVVTLNCVCPNQHLWSAGLHHGRIGAGASWGDRKTWDNAMQLTEGGGRTSGGPARNPPNPMHLSLPNPAGGDTDSEWEEE